MPGKSVREASRAWLREVEMFWPEYLRDHSHPGNRRAHRVGSWLTLGISGLGLLTGRPSVVVLGPVVGYACAWYGHFMIQRNVPITFSRPVLASIGNWRMFSHMIRGT